jgi:penicillin amidase
MTRLGLARALLAGAALAVVAIAAGAYAVRRPLPLRDGTVRLAGLTAPVEVSFDAAGVPHVRAETALDAWRALGWLHAEDRFFQMEMRRRAGAGRLAEIFGPVALDLDREARRSGFALRAGIDAAGMPPADRAVLDAYAEGVNAHLGQRPRPLELVALRVTPERWTAEDSLAFGWNLFAELSDSGTRELQILDAVRAHGVDPVAEILRAAGEPVDEIDSALRSLPPRVGMRPEEAERGTPRAASNAWAVAGGRTAGGAPLLASDPHLGPEVPGIWYAAHLRSEDGLHVAGLTLAGAPGVFIGHNGRVAWGITMHQADDTDFFLEDLDFEQGTTLEPDGSRAPVVAREETIAVDGEEPFVETVGTTPRGTLFLFDEKTTAWSRAWAAGSSRHALSAFLGFGRAGSAEGLREAARRYGGPSVNLVWAESGGRVGMFAAGSVPARRSGRGRFPARASDGTRGWLGTIPFDELPRIDDPPEGFVASANDDWSESGRALPYPGHYASSHRVRRIREVLAATPRATIDDFRALQNDLLSGYALRVSAGLGDLRAGGGDAARAAEVLASWDGRAEIRGPAALFYPFLAEARRAAFEAREERAGAPLPVGWDLMAALLDGSAPASIWDDPGTPERETREGIVTSALEVVLRSVEREDGSDPAEWNWGGRHRLAIEHPLWSRIPLLSALADPRAVELPGEWHNPRVAGFGLRSARADVVHVASARLLVDLGDPDRSRLVLPLGQSAHLGDPHRLDHLPAWVEGRDFPLPFTEQAVARASVSSLRLVP